MTTKKIRPIITCNPWNPVKIKKEFPNTLSLNLILEFIYSYP